VSSNKSVWLGSIGALFPNKTHSLASLRRVELLDGAPASGLRFFLDLLPQLTHVAFELGSRNLDSNLDALAAGGSNLRSVKLKLPFCSFKPSFLTIANNFRNVECMWLLVELPEQSTAPHNPKWRQFVAALPPSLRDLRLNAHLSDLGTFDHLPNLCGLHALMDDWLVRACHESGFPRISETTSQESKQRVLDHWISLLTKVNTQLPGALALHAVLTASFEMMSPWGEEIAVYTNTLLEFAVSEEWVPVDVLVWIHNHFSGLAWDADRPTFGSADVHVARTIIEEAFRSASDEKLMWILKNVRPNLLESPSRLPYFLSQRDPNTEIARYCIDFLMEESIAASGLSYDQLGRFFKTKDDEPTNLLLQTKLHAIVPLVLESEDVRHRLSIDLNARLSSSGETVLHQAVAQNISEDLLSGLLRLGAPSIKDMSGRTCVDRCLDKDRSHLLNVFSRHSQAYAAIAPQSREKVSEEQRKHISASIFKLASSGSVADAVALFPLVYLKDILEFAVSVTFLDDGDALIGALTLVCSNWKDESAVLPPSSSQPIDPPFIVQNIVTKARLARKSAPSHLIESFILSFDNTLAKIVRPTI
jgi:hypothetical protein